MQQCFFKYGFYTASLMGYIWLCYSKAGNFFQIVVLYSALFVIYAILLKIANHSSDSKVGIFAGIFFRIALFFALPNLSGDFYRFIWDGRLLADGENPFLHLPSYYMENSNVKFRGINEALFNHLNSPNYFTVYPPVSQYIFLTACKIFPESVLGSVVIMRSFILLAEIGNIYLLDKLTYRFQISKKTILIYALNPLVIVELTGNLHLEAIMIFFLLLSIYLLTQSSCRLSAISLALSAATKLLPLLFLPFLLKRLGLKKSIIYYLTAAFFLLLLFLPFLDKEALIHLFSSISLYFQKFEFNASVYYLIRWIGYETVGYNVIRFSGVGFGILTIFAIAYIALTEKRTIWESLPQAMLWALTCYFAFATTVHPWYVTTLVALSVFSNYRYAIVWSALIPLTYLNYQLKPYQENLWLIAAEYIVVSVWLIYETWWKNHFRNVSEGVKSILQPN